MIRLSVVGIFVVLLSLTSVSAQEYRAIFWNLESGESNNTRIANQMVEKGPVAFWGLSEVPNQAALDTFERALEAAHGSDYITKLSEEGGGDRLAILYRADSLTAVPYSGSASVDDIGDNFFEVDSINVSGTVRPGLGIQLQGEDGQQVVVLVHHWKCCGGSDDIERRQQQAMQLNAFAIATPDVPIISGGDYNIEFHGDGLNRPAFQELIRIWEHKELQSNVGSFRTGSVLDGVFVTNKVAGWESSASILNRNGNEAATSRRFDDSQADTDHRPILLVVRPDNNERIDALREEIAVLTARLQQLMDELARLEANN